MCEFDGTGHELDPECPWCGDAMKLVCDQFYCLFCGYTEEVPHAAGL